MSEPSNLERYKKDLAALIELGEKLHIAMQYECFPEEVKTAIGARADEVIKKLPNFGVEYQRWYSEAKLLIKQLLPDRLNDFVGHYEKPKQRKEIVHSNYTIEDYLQNLAITRGYEKQKVVGPDSAIVQFRQQLAILNSVKARFESSLCDIRQLVQADLFDSELAAAEELMNNKFLRSAGALAGVILEKHLAEVCESHAVKLSKKDPTIADLNNALKDTNVLDTPQWRYIQHLADIRNLCDHNKKSEPTADQLQDLLSGVKKITKTLF